MTYSRSTRVLPTRKTPGGSSHNGTGMVSGSKSTVVMVSLHLSTGHCYCSLDPTGELYLKGKKADDFANAHAAHAPRTGRSYSFAGQLAGLLHPIGEQSFVQVVVLVDV